jgi:hypothetical protein
MRQKVPIVAALLTAITVLPDQVQPADVQLPLSVERQELQQGGRGVQFVLRNDGAVPIVAWTVRVIRSAAGGPRTRHITADSYLNSAPLNGKATNVRTAAIEPGTTIAWAVPLTTRDAEMPTNVRVEPVAALLADNRLLGEEDKWPTILGGRERDRAALQEVCATFTDVLGGDHEPRQRLGSAFDALSALGKSTERAAARHALRSALAKVEAGAVDGHGEIARLLQNCRRRLDLATLGAAQSVRFVPVAAR